MSCSDMLSANGAGGLDGWPLIMYVAVNTEHNANMASARVFRQVRRLKCVRITHSFNH